MSAHGARYASETFKSVGGGDLAGNPKKDEMVGLERCHEGLQVPVERPVGARVVRIEIDMEAPERCRSASARWVARPVDKNTRARPVIEGTGGARIRLRFGLSACGAARSASWR